MRTRLFRWTLLTTALLRLLGSQAASAETDAVPVKILVLKEHGVGSQTLAQPYLDKFVAMAAEQNDWQIAKGQYFTSRAAAETFILNERPHYGILSLAAFLAFREKYQLEVIGEVATSLAGGRQYFVISKGANDFAGCKGKTLASDHADDSRFIDRVVAGGTFKLEDFTLVHSQRPLQTIRKVVNGEAMCALVDDAQHAELSHLEGADGVHTVWTSAELPPMAIVAFPAAPAEERTQFRENLSKLCEDDGQSACAEVGIVSLKASTAADYKSAIAAYGK